MITNNPYYDELPRDVLELMHSSVFCEYASLNAQGLAIDTPTFAFMPADSRSLDVATGLAYPVKAERARRNPRVGLLLEGLPGEPIVAISALAAVRDASIQANADRYVAETIAYYDSYAYGHPWSAGRKAVYYWARIFVQCTPQKIYWWPSAAHLNEPPQQWLAATDTEFPKSDPAPSTGPSRVPAWSVHDWRTRAREMQATGLGAHLSVVDDAGFPMPIRVSAATPNDEGFELVVPRGVPWRIAGPATLSYVGLAIFVGKVLSAAGRVRFQVERILPTLPTVQDPREIWTPSAATYAGLMGRLEEELARRGQPLPQIPEIAPTPTEGSLRRAQRMQRIAALTPGG